MHIFIFRLKIVFKILNRIWTFLLKHESMIFQYFLYELVCVQALKTVRFFLLFFSWNERLFKFTFAKNYFWGLRFHRLIIQLWRASRKIMVIDMYWPFLNLFSFLHKLRHIKITLPSFIGEIQFNLSVLTFFIFFIFHWLKFNIIFDKVVSLSFDSLLWVVLASLKVLKNFFVFVVKLGVLIKDLANS